MKKSLRAEWTDQLIVESQALTSLYDRLMHAGHSLSFGEPAADFAKQVGRLQGATDRLTNDADAKKRERATKLQRQRNKRHAAAEASARAEKFLAGPIRGVFYTKGSSR